MNYLNGTSSYLKDGFVIPSFAEYAKDRLAKLAQEINAPCYAVEGEQACLDRLHEYIQENPYRWFESRSNLVAEQVETRNAKSLTRLSDPLLYECVQDACTALAIQNPAAFTYADAKGQRDDAKAMAHMDMMWIFISERFRENGILSDLELCFIIGRMLGQAAARHADVAETQELTPEQRRTQELTMDRAGLLAALWRTAGMYPSLSADELVRKAVDAAAQGMHKLDVLDKLKKNQVTLQALQMMMEMAPVEEKHAKKGDGRPTTWERISALRQFAVSMPFVRCISALWGEDHLIVQSYSGAGLLQKNISGSLLG